MRNGFKGLEGMGNGQSPGKGKRYGLAGLESILIKKTYTAYMKLLNGSSTAPGISF